MRPGTFPGDRSGVEGSKVQGSKVQRFKVQRFRVRGFRGSRVQGFRVQAQQGKSIFEQARAQTRQSSKDFKPAPEKIKTRYGALDFPGGYPTEKSAQKVYDELDLQRATQLYLDMYPALSMRGMMIGTARDYGSRNSSDIAVTADRLDSSAMFLTGNTESIYAMILFDLKVDGPTVFEAPPGLMGPVDDANFLFLFDVGRRVDKEGDDGTDFRTQFTTRYSF